MQCNSIQIKYEWVLQEQPRMAGSNNKKKLRTRILSVWSHDIVFQMLYLPWSRCVFVYMSTSEHMHRYSVSNHSYMIECSALCSFSPLCSHLIQTVNTTNCARQLINYMVNPYTPLNFICVRATIALNIWSDRHSYVCLL